MEILSIILQITAGIFLLICAVTDIREKSVYLMVLLPFFAAGIGGQLILGRRSLFDVAGGIIVGILILLLSLATKGRIGEGDGLVLMVTGSFLGFMGNMQLLFVALMISAAISVILLIIKRRGLEREIPFMPFLLLSFILQKGGVV